MITTMPASTWNVRVDRWLWVYTFIPSKGDSNSGTVTWRDPFNGMTGNGTWHTNNKLLAIAWKGANGQISTSADVWTWPADPKEATGTCTTKDGTFKLKAEALGDLGKLAGPVSEERVKELQTLIDRAKIRNLEIATSFDGFISAISIPYSQAYSNHMNFVKDMIATEKLALDVLIGLALAGLGGAAGGSVAGVMKSLSIEKPYIVDGMKDLAKFVVRQSGTILLQSVTGSYKPASQPDQWQNAINERVKAEFTVMVAMINDWRSALDARDPQFPYDSDPVAQVNDSIYVSFEGNKVRMCDLTPNFDKDTLRISHEIAWLAAWITKNARPVMDNDVLGLTLLGKVQDYVKTLNDDANLKEVLNKQWPILKSSPNLFSLGI